MAGRHFFDQGTIRGFKLGECVSAFQKAIRRGDEQGAVCWAVEIDQSGFGNILWSRILVITTEDVGLAWPEGPAVIRALYENWKDFQPKKGRPKHSDRLWTLHAVMLLARSQKSRRVDNAIWASYAVEEPLVAEIPDYALDSHTARGKALGKRKGDQSSYMVENEADLGDNFWYTRKEEYRARVGLDYSRSWFNAQGRRVAERASAEQPDDGGTDPLF